MADTPFAINDKTNLANISRTDRLAVSRANVLYRVDVQDMPSRMTWRKQMVPPILTDFGTWVNQSTGDIAQLSDAVRLFGPANTPTGANPMARVRALPGGSWDVLVGCIRGFTFINFHNGGLILRESGTGKITVCGFGVPNSDRIQVQYYNSPTSFGGNLRNAQEKNTNIVWFRARKVSTNIEYMYSLDGVCWASLFVNAITAHFTTAPDQWGFYLECNNSGLSTNATLDVIDWSE